MISKRIKLLYLAEPSIYPLMVILTSVIQLKVHECDPCGVDITLNVLFSHGRWELHYHFEFPIKF
jgi:hypothetical protein